MSYIVIIIIIMKTFIAMMVSFHRLILGHFKNDGQKWVMYSMMHKAGAFYHLVTDVKKQAPHSNNEISRKPKHCAQQSTTIQK